MKQMADLTFEERINIFVRMYNDWYYDETCPTVCTRYGHLSNRFIKAFNKECKRQAAKKYQEKWDKTTLSVLLTMLPKIKPYQCLDKDNLK